MKNIYITFHYTSHGIAYLKHVLSAFYAKKCKVDDDLIRAEKISQIEMNDVFSEKKSGFLFDEIYYLTAPQQVFDRISSRRHDYRYLITKDAKIIEQQTVEVWQSVIEKEFDKIEDEIDFVKRNYPNKDQLFISQMWRDIQHYKISEQINWLKNYSNAPKQLVKNLIVKELPIKDLRDAKDIAFHLTKFLTEIYKKNINAQFTINISLGSNETQVVWQILAQNDFFKNNTKLIKTYDNKASKIDVRFKEFDIIEVSKKIISEISANIKVYEKPISRSRKLADAKMQAYIKSGFTVLLLGERGIGKTRLAEKYKTENQNFVSVNCASFTNNLLAESFLFGYKKGSFTDAKEDREGVFEQAKNGILFLDEIHHLDKSVQAKLMKAIETDKNNFFTIKRLGDDKEQKLKTTLIFASNRKIEELRDLLLPDFFDRIAQLIIEIPALKESKEDIQEDFKVIWSQMRFEEFYKFDENIKNDKNLLDWLRIINLPGNYRDLQKIAIYYKTFLDFDIEIKKLLKERTAFDFTKKQFENYIAIDEKPENELFNVKKNPFELIGIYQKVLSEKIINHFGSAKKAEQYYVDKGYKITDRTLFNWKKENN